jgi:hypothetical protein
MGIFSVPAAYTARQLVRVLRHARADPSNTYQTPGGDRMSASEFRRWFRVCLMQKINRQLQDRTRKLGADYQRGLYRDAQRLKGYGGFGKILETPEVRARIGDHVHFYVGGQVRVCADGRDCEDRH